MSAAGVDAAAERSELVRGALAAARDAHAGQTRETGDGEMQFIEHPLAVAERLAQQGCSDELLAAGLLHDTVENSATELDELRERFGEDVAHLVGALTEDEGISSYEERKEEHRNRVAAAGSAAQAVFAADKLANLTVLRDAYAARGESVDEDLQVPLDTKIHTWELDLEMLRAGAPEPASERVRLSQIADLTGLVSELADQLEALRRQRSERRSASG